jgi:hypothetical protein
MRKAKSRKQKAKILAVSRVRREHFCFLLFAFCFSPVGVVAS